MWMVGQMLVKVQLLCVQHGLRLAWEWLPLQSHLHYPRPFILLQKRKAHSSPPYQERHDSLILNVDSAKMEGGEVLIYPFLNPGGEGILCPPFHIFAYYCANTRASTLKKLDFSYLWVWERALRFLPHEIISFSKKNKSHQKNQNFIRALNASRPTKDRYMKTFLVWTPITHFMAWHMWIDLARLLSMPWHSV